jgi:agmatine deiminase
MKMIKPIQQIFQLATMVSSLMIFFSCGKPKDQFHMPAEWEQHDAVWLGWEKDTIRGYYPPIIKAINTLTPNVKVKMAFNSDSLMQVAKHYLIAQKVDTANIRFYVMPGDRYWIRDHGAAFLTNGKGELGVADFAWNSYGRPGFLKEKYNGNMDSVQKYLDKYKVYTKKTGSVDSLMAVAEGAKILKTDVVHEGGAIEVNGKGTLILCEATVFERNPDLKKEYIESEFKRVLGVSKIIWMKKGLADDPLHFFRKITGNYYGGGTGGHTDEFVRFANATTILLAWVEESEKDNNPVNQMNYERMCENLKILESATDQDGKPFTIVKVPLPDFIFKKVAVRKKIEDNEVTLDIELDGFIPSETPKLGDSILRVPAASYMNYLVTNGLVMLPTYTAMGSSKEKEERVEKIFKEYFPDRKVVFIDMMPQNWEGGGLHCSTQQQPVKSK